MIRKKAQDACARTAMCLHLFLWQPYKKPTSTFQNKTLWCFIGVSKAVEIKFKLIIGASEEKGKWELKMADINYELFLFTLKNGVDVKRVGVQL